MGTIKKLYQDQLVGGSGGAGQEVYPVTSALGVYDTDNNQLQGVLDKLTTNLELFTCGTSAATAAKAVSASKFVLMEGGSVKIKFTYANSAASPTLAIGSTAAKPIIFNGSAASASNSWGAGEIVEFFYDGTNWVGSSTSVSVSQNTSTGHTDITIGSTTTPVASVEEVSQLGQEVNKISKSPYIIIEEKRENKSYYADGSSINFSTRLAITYYIPEYVKTVFVSLKSGGTSNNPQRLLFWDENGSVLWSSANVADEVWYQHEVAIVDGTKKMTIVGDISEPVYANIGVIQDAEIDNRLSSLESAIPPINERTRNIITGYDNILVITKDTEMKSFQQTAINARTGETVTANNTSSSNFIKVPKRMVITSSHEFANYGLAFYEDSDISTYISGVVFNQLNNYEVTIPNNARYFRACSSSKYDYTTITCTYGIELQPLPQPIYNLITKLNKPYTWGSSCVWFGASTTYGIASSVPPPGLHQITDCYAKIISDKLGFTSYDNRAVSGSKICDSVNADSIYNKVMNYSGSANTIFINGGLNDFTNGSPVGTIDDMTTDTFCGCFNLMLKHIKEDLQATNVIIIQPQTASPAHPDNIIAPLDAYREVLGQIAVKWGFDTIAGDIIFFGERGTLFSNIMMADGMHPTELGHRYYGEGVCSLLI